MLTVKPNLIIPICYTQLYIHLTMLKYLHVYIQKLNGKFSWECRLEPQLSKLAVNSSSSEWNVECFVSKGEHVLTSCEPWKKLAVNEQWELAKKLGLCFRCLKRGHRIERCSLKGTCPVEGRVRRHHPQLHAVIGLVQFVMIVKQTFGLVSKGFNLQKPRATYTSQNGVFTERVRWHMCWRALKGIGIPD